MSKEFRQLATQFRVGRSKLNGHSYSIGLKQSATCDCLNSCESICHHISTYFLYQPERQILYSKVKQFIPNFESLSDSRKTDILIYGVNQNDPDFFNTNI